MMVSTASALACLTADYFSLRAGNWKQNNIVLILSLGRLAFGGKHADDGEWNVLDTDRLANGICVAE